MRGHGVTKLVNGIYNYPYCCIEANRVVRERNVIINRTRQSHCLNSQLAELVSSFVRAVTTDNHKAVDAHFIQDVRTFLLTFRLHEFKTSRRLQNGTSTLNNIAYTAQIHRENVPVQQTLIAALDTIHFNPVKIALRTTARTAAFMPCESPPLVNTAIFLTLVILFVPP